MTHSRQKKIDILQDRFGLKTASYLSAGAADLPYDISERLRAARVQAVAQRKVAKPVVATSVVSNGGSAALTLGGGDEGMSWWARLGMVVPLVALVVGLLAINSIQNDKNTRELAEVDSALLTDDLPPAAFSDPGFVQFLKTQR